MNEGTRSIGVLALVVGFVLAPVGCDQSDDTPRPDSPKPTQAATDAPAAVVPAPNAPREGWPTEDEVKAAIFKVEYEIRASETNKQVWHVKDMRHEVKSVQLAKQTTQKQMNYGASAITVYPARVLYTRVTEYTSKPATREELGADGVWFLYRDSFGEWTGKYGKE